MVEALGHKTGGSGLDSRYGPWKLSSDLVLLSAFSSPDTQPLIEMKTRDFLGGKCGRRVQLSTLLFKFCRMAK
jgi:hypothetical protein